MQRARDQKSVTVSILRLVGEIRPVSSVFHGGVGCVIFKRVIFMLSACMRCGVCVCVCVCVCERRLFSNALEKSFMKTRKLPDFRLELRSSQK